jgi:hypothetical protein
LAELLSGAYVSHDFSRSGNYWPQSAILQVFLPIGKLLIEIKLFFRVFSRSGRKEVNKYAGAGYSCLRNRYRK